MNLQDIFADLGVKTNVTLIILTGALMMCRIVPIIWLSSFLGGDAVPNEVRVGLGMVLTVVMFPSVAAQAAHVPTAPIAFALLICKELLVGFILSFVGVTFDAFTMAGGLTDLFSGASMAQVYVPQIQERVTLMSSLKIQLAIALFLTLNGHHIVIEALGDSFRVVPLDGFPAMSQGRWPLLEMVLRGFADLLGLAFTIASPALMATFLTDLSLGMINKVAPQIQVFFISMAIKPLVATTMVMMVLALLTNRMTVEFRGMLQSFRQAFLLMQ